jgi:hypothetical protein
MLELERDNKLLKCFVLELNVKMETMYFMRDDGGVFGEGQGLIHLVAELGYVWAH